MLDVSVIIPTWNRERSLLAAINSCLGQTVTPKEILVCDDGSNDGSEDLVRALRHPAVIWVPGKRSGRPAAPRNRGLRLASSEWVAFLDSDDLWTRNKLELQVAAILRHGGEACCTNAERVDPNGNSIGVLLSRHDGLLLFQDLLRDNHVVCSSVLIRRELMLSLGGFPEDKNLLASEDYAVWLKAATVADFYFLSVPLVIYMDNPVESVRSKGLQGDASRLAVLQHYRTWCRKTKVVSDWRRRRLAALREVLRIKQAQLRSRVRQMLKARRLTVL